MSSPLGYNSLSVAHIICRRLTPHQVQTSFGNAPVPVPGANTFFGQRGIPPTPHDSAAQPPQPDLPPATKGGLFRQPTVQQKMRFATKLQELANGWIGSSIGSDGGLDMQNQVVADIQAELQRKARGFLPDNQQWKNLAEMLEHERFGLATLTSVLSAKFLASASKQLLMDRSRTLDNLSHEEFEGRLRSQRGARVSWCSLGVMCSQLTVSGIRSQRCCTHFRKVGSR